MFHDALVPFAERRIIKMKKRTAYIGISYPLLYDYRYQSDKRPNDLLDSPNPIIESPLGLMIFYDEILFLCRSVCPNNMRNLPYVRFVDELFPDFCFKDLLECADEMRDIIFVDNDLSYEDIKSALNVGWDGIDQHTHGLKIGDIRTAASPNHNGFLLDLYVFQALQELYDQDIELVTNSKYNLGAFNNNSVKAEFIEKIIIPGIPNYIGTSGPYHECMEELRENKYLKDFRHWVIENHNNIQKAEITEMCDTVEKSINETKETLFKKYLENNSEYSFFKSTATTLIKTTAGLLYSPISVIDAFAGNIIAGKRALSAKSVRWQGFVTDSRKIVAEISRLP